MLRLNIVNELRERIAVLPPHAPVMSTSQLCGAYGISALTASRVLKQLASDGVVYSRKGSGTYVAERPASAAAKVLVAFHMSGGDPASVGAAFGVIYESIAQGVEACGRAALSANYYDLKRPAFTRELAGKVCGVIASASVVDELTTPLLDALAVPVVILQHETPRPGYYSQVLPDIENGFFEAMRHFRGRGLERLAIAGSHVAREVVAKDAALRAGFPPDAVRSYYMPSVHGDLGRLAGRDIGRAILADAWADCVFSVSDFNSFGLLDAMAAAGLKPGDLPLMSFDNLEGEGLLPFGEPLLSSLSFPKREIAAAAVKLLDSMVTASDRSKRIVMVPTAMTLRKTA